MKPLLKNRRSSLRLKFLKNAFEEVNILIATFKIVIFKNTFFSRKPPVASPNITLNLTSCSRLLLFSSVFRTLLSLGCYFFGYSALACCRTYRYLQEIIKSIENTCLQFELVLLRIYSVNKTKLKEKEEYLVIRGVFRNFQCKP